MGGCITNCLPKNVLDEVNNLGGGIGGGALNAEEIYEHMEDLDYDLEVLNYKYSQISKEYYKLTQKAAEEYKSGQKFLAVQTMNSANNLKLTMDELGKTISLFKATLTALSVKSIDIETKAMADNALRVFESLGLQYNEEEFSSSRKKLHEKLDETTLSLAESKYHPSLTGTPIQNEDILKDLDDIVNGRKEIEKPVEYEPPSYRTIESDMTESPYVRRRTSYVESESPVKSELDYRLSRALESKEDKTKVFRKSSVFNVK